MTVHQLRAPSKARSEIERAQQELARNQVEEANRHLSRALAAYPNYSVALALRALLELRAGRIDQATADLQNAVTVDPEYGAPYVMLASIYNDAKRYDDALEALAKARQLAPVAWQTHLEMARALYGKTDDAGALREVTAALRLVPSTENAGNLAILHFWRASVLMQLKDNAGARAEYQQTVDLDPGGDFAAASRQALQQLQGSALH